MTGTKKLAILIPYAFVLIFASLSASAQPAPQTARQALLEMFFSKTPGTFEKHLPQATRPRCERRVRVRAPRCSPAFPP